MRIFVTNETSLFDQFEGYKYLSLNEALEALEPLEWIGLDTETTGLDCYLDKVMLLQMGSENIQVVIHIGSFEKFPKELKDFIERKHCILQNAKFDLKMLYTLGVIPTKVYDTMLMEQLLTNGLENVKVGLDTLSKKYCNLAMDKSVRDEMVREFRLTQRVLDYSALDVVPLHRIKAAQEKELKALRMEGVAKIENLFVCVLAYIEWCGIKLDTEKWKVREQVEKQKLNVNYADLLDILERHHPEYFSNQLNLFDTSRKCTLNFNSPAQVKELFKKEGVNITFKEKGKTIEAVDKKHLADQINDFPLLQVYFKYKEAAKQVGTYGSNWFGYINPKTNRIHSEFRQIANTGRLKCGNAREGKPKRLGLNVVTQ